jgi:hypothetical protein
MATRACKTLVIGAGPIELALPFNPGLGAQPQGTPTQLIDRGDHIDAITDTTVTSLVIASSDIQISATEIAPALCGPVALSAGVVASICNAPSTVVRTYDTSYALVHENQLDAQSSGQQIVGGASSWLVAWDGVAATIGADAQPIAGPISEPGVFVHTACGFVAVNRRFVGGTATYEADFDAPSGAYNTFDTRPGGVLFDLAPATWPYDGESFALLLDGRTLDLVRRNRETIFNSDIAGTLYPTPIGLVAIETNDFTPNVDGLGVRVFGPDGATSPRLMIATYPDALINGEPIAVWSGNALVVMWQTVDTNGKGATSVYSASVRCAD